MSSLSKAEQIVSWCCRIVAAGILAQTLFFKFTGAEESIYIFSRVGLEPWGRYGSGIAELIATILLVTPRFAWAGALLALGVISGALVSHLTVLGIVVKDDGGLLFGLAITVFVASAVTAFLHRRLIPVVSQLFKPQTA
jgi:putative oxidoreductase